MRERWELRKREEVFKDSILRIEHRDFHYKKNNSTGTFTVISMKDWAVIVPVTSDGKLILVRQFRVATDEVTYEFPGGAIEHGEDPLTGAVRELREETGYTGSLELLSKMRPNPSFMDNFCYSYLALGCEKTNNLDLDPFEDIEIVVVTFQELERMIEKGQITHSITLAAYGAYKALKG